MLLRHGHRLLRPVVSLGVFFTGAVIMAQNVTRVEITAGAQTRVLNLSHQPPGAGDPEADADGNGIPDGWERMHFGHTGIDPAADADGDGLSNLQEYQHGTQPKAADTDGDGLTDGQEVSWGTNPKDAGSAQAAAIKWLAERTQSGVLPDTVVVLPALSGFEYEAGHPSSNVRYTTMEVFHSGGWVEYVDTYTYTGPTSWHYVTTYPGANPPEGDKSRSYVFNERNALRDLGVYYGALFTDTEIIFSGTVSVRLSGPVQPTIIPGAPYKYTSSINGWPPTVTSSSAETQSVIYHLEVPAGFSGTIRWLEVFTPADNSATKQYLAREWIVDGLRSPDYSMTPPASGTATVVPYEAQLAVDANRDGTIKLASENASDVTSAANPYRFWINDDDDSGDMGGDDIPGKTTGANYVDVVVNGTRDLVDFFPVFLDLKQLLTVLPPSASVKYKLKQADNALNFVYTNLARHTTASRGGAVACQKKVLTTGFGPDFTQAAGAATTQQITAAGIELSSAFLAGVKDSDWGVLLIEGRAATTAPLVLSVEKDGTTIAEGKLELRISNVEDMFRHIDLTDVPREYDGTAVTPPVPAAPTRASDPGAPYPDSATNGKYFVFVHGFNVNGQRARGWNTEIFKRLYQMGSHARFVGVTWNGATGVQLPNGSYTDYHKAVFHAFQTGDQLAARLTSNGVTGDVTVAAHSLGNMVASQAIQYGGFSPMRYYMINTAVPVEAYHLGSVGSADLARMTCSGWDTSPFSNGDGRLFAANWYQLFVNSSLPDGNPDRRKELTWKGRFADVLQNAYDFYSPGDDVVEDPKTNSPSLLNTVINQGFSSSHGAWGLQELAKGTFSIASVFFSRTQAGWGKSITGKESPFDANPTSDSLKEEPFFASFNETDLFSSNPITASAMAGQKKVQYDVLARGIPALSFATAIHPLVPLGTSRNFNMEIQGRTQNQWPTEGHTKDGRDVGRWLHSDFKNVALPYVFQMYQEMINRGSL